MVRKFSLAEYLGCSVAAFALLVATLPGIARADSLDPKQYTRMSLDELSDMEITSVSKRAEKASEAPAAVYVLTDEDIHHSGATTIPELLRMVPGLSVAQAGSHQWAISSRGFNDQFSNKLLVLIDGRTVYTPLFSGVYWDVQDTVLEDIDRIEVIRGPGATLWGANAVNGVINIITKHTKDTKGGYFSSAVGNHERGIVSGRYGAGVGDNLNYRAYASSKSFDEVRGIAGGGARDEWHKEQAGFRTDWDHSDVDNLTVQGDIYHGREDSWLDLPSFTAPFTQDFFDDSDLGGANILARWKHSVEEGSDLTFQTYFDHTYRDDFYLEQRINTFDLDLQHVLAVSERNQLIWGAGYRLVDDNLRGTEYLNYDPKSRAANLWSAFIQNEFALVPDQLLFTIGSKFEHNDYTGFEWQPSTRLALLIDEHHTLWGSISRAVRTPNRTMEDVAFTVAAAPGAPPRLLKLVGNDDVDSEELIAYEAGYRVQPIS